MRLSGCSLLAFFSFVEGYTNDTRILRRHDLHIGDSMANLKFLIVCVLAFCTSSASAGYAQVSPPPTWSGSGNWWYKPSANDVSFSGGVRGASGVINVAGRSVTMPAAYRFAANASRLAASSAFGHPALFVGLGAASLVYQWYVDNGFEVQGGIWKKRVTTGTPCSPCYEYKVNGQWDVWATSVSGAASGWASLESAASQYYSYAFNGFINTSSNLVGIRTTCKAAGCGTIGSNWDQNYLYSTRQTTASTGVTYQTATRDDFENTMATKPVPAGVPQVWPLPDLWPVELPILNPTPEPVPKPNPVPVPSPQPMRIPQGEPQLVPNSDPQDWRTPVIDIVPSPTVTDPWRVDIQPKDIISNSPEPLPEIAPVPPVPDPNQEAQPREEAIGLCDQYPDILACKKEIEIPPSLCEEFPDSLACQEVELDTPEEDPLEEQDKNVSVQADGGWGGGGSCPAPRHINGANVDFSFQPLCDALGMFRPILVAIAWLSAGLILLGVKGGD